MATSAFSESVDLLGVIRNILQNYPYSPALLRELLQNSDDAKATIQVGPIAGVTIDKLTRFRHLCWTVETTHRMAAILLLRLL